MGREKFNAEKKIAIIKAYKAGEVAYSQLREVYGMNPNEIYRWICKFEQHGEAAFQRGEGNARYSKEFKLHCVEEYLSGEGSLDSIATKYNLPAKEMLRRWVMQYNANRELKDYDPKREVYMAEARRKTTLEERKEITEYCIAHDKDYKGTAAFYNVSYSQVYTWVRKYLASGESGLEDGRGHRKADGEVDELERLRRENQRLKQQLEEKDKAVALLKKAKEYEGM